MANKYTRFVPSEYVPQYQPVNMGMVGEVLANARGRRETAELSDVRAQSAMQNAIGEATSPEERDLAQAIFDRYAPSIDKRQGEGYSSRDLLRTQLDAEKATNALSSIQEVREARSQWTEDFRELNQDRITDPTELAFWESQMAPGIEYDTENLRARIGNTTPRQLAEDVNIAEKVMEYADGMESDIFKDEEGNPLIRQSIDPVTGKLRIDTTSGVSPDRVRYALDKAFALDPEIQAMRNRKRDYYTAQYEQTEGGGTDALEALKENAEGPAKAELESSIEQLREAGVSDARILAQMEVNKEMRDAQGLGRSKYAYSDIETNFTSLDQSKADKRGEELNTFHSITDALNNPNLMDMPEEVTYAAKEDIESTIRSLRESITPRGPLFKIDQELKEITEQEIAELQRKMQLMPEAGADIAEYAKTDDAKELYGDALKTLTNDFPKRDGESPEAYANRINQNYQQMLQMDRSNYGHYEMYGDAETRTAQRENIIGSRIEGVSGQIEQSDIYVTDPQTGTSERMNLPQLAEYLGHTYEPGGDFEENFQKHATVIGEFNGSDPQIPSGYLATIRNDGGYFEGPRTITLKIASPDIQRQAVYEPLRQITAFGTNPRQSNTTVEYTDRSGANIALDLIKENQYVDANGQPADPSIDDNVRYTGSKVGMKVDEAFESERTGKKYEVGDVIWEDSLDYQHIINGIPNR